MSNSLDPDQDLHFVGPDLDPNSLQRLSADDKNCCEQGRAMGGSKGSWVEKDDTWHTSNDHFGHVMLGRAKISRITAIRLSINPN